MTNRRKRPEENAFDVSSEDSPTMSRAIRGGFSAPGAEPKPKKPVRPPKVVKERLTVHISVDLIDRIKNAVYWTPGMTLASLAEDAFSKAVDNLEKKRGEPYPARTQELKGGRPLK